MTELRHQHKHPKQEIEFPIDHFAKKLSPSGEPSVLPREQEQQLLLPINANSTISSDIQQIIHDSKESEIEIHLMNLKERRCKFPIFKGRISGLSLSLIKWEVNSINMNTDTESTTTNSSNNIIIIGKYDKALLPFSGRYYIEILILLCKKTAKFEDDIHEECLEDTENNRITSNGAYIDVVKEDEDEDEDEDAGDATTTTVASATANIPVTSLGQWYHQNIVASKNNTVVKTSFEQQLQQQQHLPLNTTARPLFTRYQPVDGCRENSTRCQNAMGTGEYPSRFSTYQFKWKNSSHSDLDFDFINHQTSMNTTTGQTGSTPANTNSYNVCFLGASHSVYHIKNCLELVDAAAGYSNVTQPTEKIMICSHLPFEFPNDVNPTSIDRILKRNYLYRSNKHICTHIVIGLFQWSFSFKVRDPVTRERRPPLLSKWKQEITNVIQTIQNSEFLAANDATPKLFLRSAHSNPLKRDTSSCPQIDWRTPINAELCSKVLQEISDENENVTFLDTDFIIGPVWDVSPDFNHYLGLESMEETKYILREVIGMNE